MKYVIRSIKYFFYFSIICAAIVYVLVAIGAAQGDINTLFKEGYTSVVKIAIFFAIVAAIYPLLGFMKKKTEISAPWAQIKPRTIEYMEAKNYVIEKEEEEFVSFRRKGFGAKLIKMYEDRITFRWDGESWVAEGLRKDVMRISSGLEYFLFAQNEE